MPHVGICNLDGRPVAAPGVNEGYAWKFTQNVKFDSISFKGLKRY